MGLLETARDALKDLPVSDILRERLSLALDQATAAEKKIEAMRDENAELKAEIKIARADAEKKSAELEALRKEHEEEVVVLDSLVFKRGKRTLGRWVPMCPVCDLPLSIDRGKPYPVQCARSRTCDWYYQHNFDRFQHAEAELPK